MAREIPCQKPQDPAVAAYARDLLDRAAALRLPELFSDPPPDALYHLPDRHGVSVVVVRTMSLSHDQLIKILTYRLAQYVALNYVDARMVYDQRMEYEPLASMSSDDIHVIAGSVSTGEILCYVVMKAVAAPPVVAFGTRERALFPVEQVFGWGVYNRLHVLPDLSLARVRELGRFVKNQQIDPVSEGAVRAPAEVSLAVFQLLSGSLGIEIAACIGDIEEEVAKKNLDLFCVPTIVIHGVVAYVPRDSFGFLAYQYRTRYPFAFLCSDIPLARLAAIEAALAQPGRDGIRALLVLKRDIQITPSSLLPREGLPAITNTVIAQDGMDMRTRRQILEQGEWLRAIDLFRSLSVAEAAVLATLLERREVAAGKVIVRRGERDDALYLIETGQAERYSGASTGTFATVNRLHPGDYFGARALVADGEHTEDVIATTPMVLLQLSKEIYTHYLAPLAEVRQQLNGAPAETHPLAGNRVPGGRSNCGHPARRTARQFDGTGLHTTADYKMRHRLGEIV